MFVSPDFRTFTVGSNLHLNYKGGGGGEQLQNDSYELV
jgi:hypothetical protein